MNDYYEREDASELSFFHSCTDGTNAGIVHFNDEDYLQATNISAICAHKSSVNMLSYCHMSTHSHFALACDNREQAEEFSFSYKREYARYIWLKYRKSKIFKDIDNAPKEIGDIFYLRNCISYILLNPVTAGIVKSPEQYKWSSFNLYFQNTDINSLDITDGNESYLWVKDLNINECKRLIHTKTKLNDSNFVIDKNGNILPSSFVNYKMVEGIFGNRTQFYKSLALTNSSHEEAKYVIKQLKFNDAEVMAECFSIANQFFKKQSITTLTKEEKIRIIPALRKKTGASPKQLARILSMKADEVAALLGIKDMIFHRR